VFGWKYRKEAERLQEEVYRLKGDVAVFARSHLVLLTERDDARVNAAKVRARSRALRKEQRRLRALLDQHGIVWRTESPDGANSTSS
jgi:hypothetical protein